MNYGTYGSLLTTPNRVETPFVRVEIGGFTFGVFDRRNYRTLDNNRKEMVEQFPNYVRRLVVNKINGNVNTYELSIDYAITYNSDPNFFEKVFSNVAQDRRIKFSYGDFENPTYAFRDESAIITKITSNVDVKSNKISYTVSATGDSLLALSGYYSFNQVTDKPSNVIKRVLWSSTFGLPDIFKGMRDQALVEQKGWIMSDDQVVTIPAQVGVSALDYINTLVSYMVPVGDSVNSVKKRIYTFTTFDDINNEYGGSYFKVMRLASSDSQLNALATYSIDIGYPSAAAVTGFSVENNENWSILYDYNFDLKTSDYVKRVNNDGEIVEIYSPMLASTSYKLTETDKAWWSKMTEYPIKASITIEGLLRPAVLMSYVKLNVWFHGNKHIYSGYYAINSQKDTISGSGISTTLGLIRVGADEDMIVRGIE